VWEHGFGGVRGGRINGKGEKTSTQRKFNFRKGKEKNKSYMKGGENLQIINAGKEREGGETLLSKKPFWLKEECTETREETG